MAEVRKIMSGVKNPGIDEVAKRAGAIPYSDTNMRRLCEGKVNIMTYAEAIAKGDINAVLGEHKAAIILFEIEDGYGHWVAVFEVSPTMCEWFDSYGLAPEEELTLIPAQFRREHGQTEAQLVPMIDRQYKELIYNSKPFQSNAKEMSTCGRWCAMRIQLRKLSLKSFQNMFLGQKLAPDQYITLMTIFNA